MIPPETRYTKVGGSYVGYQVMGDGPIDLVYVTGIVSNVDVQWDFPPVARMLEVVGSGLAFEDRGAHALKGVPGRWRLFSVA